MKESIARLIRVKTIVTFAIVAAFIVLALRGDIEQGNVVAITSTVIAFYFGTQKRDEGNSDKE